MSLLDHIHARNRWQPADFRPFVVAGEAVGLVRGAFAQALADLGEDFALVDDVSFFAATAMEAPPVSG